MSTPRPQPPSPFGLAIVLPALLSLACGGGQSGTEGPGEGFEPKFSELVPCPCQLGSRAVALEATVLEADACGAAVQVSRVLGGGERAAVDVGDSLWGMRPSCGAAIEPGDAALALYVPGQTPDGDDAVLLAVPFDVGVRVEQTVEAGVLTAEDLDVLLDTEACKAFFERHRRAPPQEPEAGEPARDELEWVSGPSELEDPEGAGREPSCQGDIP